MEQTEHLRLRWPAVVETAILLLATVFLALHWVHLTADFPNNSPWMDWSKYTDEGWYGDAAIRHYLLGHWNVPGDFNPGAALPVWPGMEMAVFRFTGVSLAAARALSVSVFGLTLVAAYFLVRRWQGRQRGLAPSIAVLLLAVSPFCFVFTRLAILEPMLVLGMLLALLAASYAGDEIAWRRWGAAVMLGLLLPVMILTKTTAVFLFPAVAWMLWAAVGYRAREFLRAGLVSGAIAAAVWAAYFVLWVRPRYLTDFRYLFSANAYSGITRATALSVLAKTVDDGMWIGAWLYPLALVAAGIGIGWMLRDGLRRSRNPLVPALLLWAAGYAAFLAYHNNLQPRYYLVIAVPLTLLAPIVFERMSRLGTGPASRAAVALAALVATIAAARDAVQTLHYVRHPEYTLVRAAEGLKNEIDRELKQDPAHSPLVLSISGSDLTLITGLPSICDDFGTMELADRVKAYRPGWYAAWNQVDDDKMDALTPTFHLERVATFPAMDDPERNELILYRLDPPLQTTLLNRKKKTVPRRLRTKIGQQPSTTQLVH